MTKQIVQTLRAAKTLGERACQLTTGGEIGAEAMSHRLSELRQLYPQVWSLLDDARGQLAALGKDVTHYDALRAKPAASAGGVLDVQLGPESKRAAVNAEGAQLAIEAVYVLRALLPEIDWMGLEDADAAELAGIGSLNPSPWLGTVGAVIAGLFVVGVIGLVVYLVAIR